MPDSGLVTHTLDMPGARLYYERRGSGPLLLLIGSPMDSTGFAGRARVLPAGARPATLVRWAAGLARVCGTVRREGS